MLNNFNLAAVAVVMAASVKTQIYGMRKKVMQLNKNLRLCAKHTHKFVRDPYGQCCAPVEVACGTDFHLFSACIDCSYLYYCPVKMRSSCVDALMQVPDHRPLTDGLSVSRYMVGIETYEPELFHVSNYSKLKSCAITPASHGRSLNLLASLMTHRGSMLWTTTLIRYCGILLSMNRLLRS